MLHWHRIAAQLALLRLVCAFSLASGVSNALAAVKDDVNLVTLQAEMGYVPSGVGVSVSMTEAVVNGGYTPMTELPDFAGKHFEFRNGIAGNSAHATEVARNFFGLSNSIAPGINTIELYDANSYLGSGFLNSGSSTLNPKNSPQHSRVGNHSWISTGTTTKGTLDVLQREDWLIERDDYIQIVGVNNGAINTSPLLSNAFNAIAVGRTDGQHAINSLSLGGVYTNYRTRPEIVAPMGATSFATPIVAAASALLVDFGHNQSYLSDGSYTPSRFPGTTIYHAETTEVVKAMLMAGASRTAFNSDRSSLLDYRAAANRRSNNGLDKRYGAGQLDVYNSFSMLMSGEQNSQADGRGLNVLSAGFDYDPHFGGAGGSNNSGVYDFIAGWTGQTLTASLAWNARIDINAVKRDDYFTAATIYDLNLSLYDMTNGTPALVASSASSNQNTENLWASLVGGRRYRMEVTRSSGQPAFDWDYGLAWSTVGTIGWRGTGVWDAGISPSWVKGTLPAAALPGAHVVFNDSGLNGQVAIVGAVEPGSVLVDNSFVPYTFQGGAITGRTGIVKRGGGQAILANNNTYTGPTVVDGGVLRVTGSIGSNGPVSVAAGAILAVDGTAWVGEIEGAGTTYVGNGASPAHLGARYVRQSSLIVSAGGRVSTWSSGGTSVLGALSLAGSPAAPTGQFDLNNNALVIDYTGASPGDTVRQQIVAGRGGPGFGTTWNGLGVSSSAAATANKTDSESRSIGYAENAALPLGAYTTFRGQPVDGTSILMAYTRTGDANLDGMVNDDDVTILGALYAPGVPNASWALGDFDYNGFVDDNDVTLMGVFYNPAAPALLAPPANADALVAAVAAVPEPTSVTLLLIGGCVLAIAYGRARRSSNRGHLVQ